MSMKMVTIHGEETKSTKITESQIFDIIDNEDWIRIETKGEYELARLQHTTDNDLRIIYQQNRSSRTMSNWIRYRALSLLVRQHPKYGPIHLDHQVELKGIELMMAGITATGIPIELLNSHVNTAELIYYEQKRIEIDVRQLIVIGTGFPQTLPDLEGLLLFKFNPDMKTIKQYYLNEFSIDHLSDLMQVRHIRFLLDSGYWQNQKQVYTSTDEVRQELRSVWPKYIQLKAYWTLSVMANPVEEYQGNGNPQDTILAAFDIDGKHYGKCLIYDSPICPKCVGAAEQNLQRVEHRLKLLKYDYDIYFSGSRGFHVYLYDPDNSDRYLQTTQEQMEILINTLYPFVDPFLSANTGEFDRHRLFKLPGTVDASTGVIVSQHWQQLHFDDILEQVLGLK